MKLCNDILFQESRTFEKETTFFSKITPLMTNGSTGPSWHPRCYLLKDNALVFEDLGLKGFTNRDKLFNEELIRSGIRALANLHGSSIIAEDNMGKTFQDVFPEDLRDVAFVKTKRRSQWFNSGVDVAIRIAEDMGLDSSKLRATFAGISKAMKSSTTKVNVINHGDMWGNNLLFNEDSPPVCKLVDFQLFRYLPVGHDLAQFFYLCASRRLRDVRKRELLTFYHRELVKIVGEGSRTPDLDEVMRGYEEQRIAACCTAALFFPTVLLDGATGAQIMDNTESYVEFCFVDRREIVLEIMKQDAGYGERIRETIRELVDMSLRADEFPEPS